MDRDQARQRLQRVGQLPGVGQGQLHLPGVEAPLLRLVGGAHGVHHRALHEAARLRQHHAVPRGERRGAERVPLPHAPPRLRRRPVEHRVLEQGGKLLHGIKGMAAPAHDHLQGCLECLGAGRAAPPRGRDPTGEYGGGGILLLLPVVLPRPVQRGHPVGLEDLGGGGRKPLAERPRLRGALRGRARGLPGPAPALDDRLEDLQQQQGVLEGEIRLPRQSLEVLEGRRASARRARARGLRARDLEGEGREEGGEDALVGGLVQLGPRQHRLNRLERAADDGGGGGGGILREGLRGERERGGVAAPRRPPPRGGRLEVVAAPRALAAPGRAARAHHLDGAVQQRAQRGEHRGHVLHQLRAGHPPGARRPPGRGERG
mmetsp:Transcript_40853/g.130452  ORF Transcript_40853/g.130452 Transcript_40853/m.130452 type:complete len:375 (-) Transcript_40853:3134-4258(-)